MNTKMAVESLCESWGETPSNVGQGHIDHIRHLYEAGEYAVVKGSPPPEYDEAYSEVCWGWCRVGDPTQPVVAAFGHGERGNEAFDERDQGLVIYFQGDQAALENARLLRASKALISKKIGFSEFKRIMRENS